MSELDDQKGTEPTDAGEGDLSTRGEFVRRAAIAGLAVPMAGSVVSAASARQSISIRERARPFEGKTLTFAEAPQGTDDKAFYAPWIKKFELKTGAKVKHTIVPWATEQAAYLTNYAGSNPYDVSYQTSTDLTALGSKGVLEDLHPWIKRRDFDRKRFITSALTPSYYRGKLYGLPMLIGTIVMYANLDLMAKAGVSSIPATTDQLVAAALKIQSGEEIWGYLANQTNADYNWYVNLQNVHNFGGDIVSNDLKRATINSGPVMNATQFVTDLINKHKVMPPVGVYDSNGDVALFKAGRGAFLVHGPDLISTFPKENLPFKWDIALPVGAPNGRRTTFSTTGHWVMAKKSKNKELAWAWIKHLTSAQFEKAFCLRYGYAPVRNDVDVSRGNPLLKKNLSYATHNWDGLKTFPQVAALLDVYGRAIETAFSGSKSVADALNAGQAEGAKVMRG